MKRGLWVGRQSYETESQALGVNKLLQETDVRQQAHTGDCCDKVDGRSEAQKKRFPARPASAGQERSPLESHTEGSEERRALKAIFWDVYS